MQAIPEATPDDDLARAVAAVADLPDDVGVVQGAGYEEYWCDERHAGTADTGREGGLPDAYADRLRLFFTDVEQDEAVLAMRSAQRARSIEQARAWAMVSDEFVARDAQLSRAERETWVMRAFVSEIATRLQLSRPAAERLVSESYSLVHDFPATLEALSSGAISYRHSQVLVGQGGTLPASARGAFEKSLLPEAARMPAARFRAVAIRARERMHPDSIVQRTREARAERLFTFEAEADGMASLHHYLPITQAMGIVNRVTRVAKKLQVDGEKRTLAQLRSDVAADLLLNGATGGEPGDVSGARSDAGSASGKNRAWGIRPTVFVTVPVMTLLGRSDEPGHLSGYGPIDPETAKRLAAQAPSFIRLLTHPETGAVLSMGRERYKVPKDLRLWLQVRDETCRGPGCGRPASECDIDHNEDWARDGLTDPNNLAHLCRQCHRMKHITTWQVVQGEDGILEWRSPTGAVHETRPAVHLPGTTLPPSDPLRSGPLRSGPSPSGPRPPSPAGVLPGEGADPPPF